MEQGVGGQGIGDVQPLGAQGLGGGAQHRHLLQADGAAFARVGIERGHRQARGGDTEVALHRFVDDAGDAAHALARHQFRQLVDRHMDGDQAGAQVLRRQHHDRPARAAEGDVGRQLGDELRVAGEAEAGRIHGRLGDGSGDQARALAGQDQVDPALDPVGHGGGIGRVGPAGDDRRGRGAVQDGDGAAEDGGCVGGTEHRLDRLALGGEGVGVADHDEGRDRGQGAGRHGQDRPGARDDLRPHAGGVAHRDDERPPRGHCLISIRASARRSRR
ncbi:hypothetical protein D3C80_930830 [compost metagenome]